jgi:hypothetical protein
MNSKKYFAVRSFSNFKMQKLRETQQNSPYKFRGNPLVAGQSEDAKKAEWCASARRSDAAERHAGPG